MRACVSKRAHACVCVSSVRLACQFVFCCFEFLGVVVVVVFRLGCLSVDVCLYLLKQKHVTVQSGNRTHNHCVSSPVS